MRSGYTKIPNFILDTPCASNPVVMYLYMWLSLHADKNGDVRMSLNEISSRTGLNKMQVRRAIEKMKVTQLVTQVATQVATQLPNTLTICFLSSCKTSKTTSDIGSDIACDIGSDTPRAYKNDNILLSCLEEKNKENISSLRSEIQKRDEKYSFEEFWDLYDKKVGREKSAKLYEAIPQGDREKIFKHVPMYKIAQPDKKFRKDPQTYLRNRSWEDEIITSRDDTRLYDNNTDKFKDGFSW